MKPWTVRTSRYVHRDRWIAVRADDCVTPSGFELNPYYVLDYPDFVHAVVLDRFDHLILVKQYRHGLGQTCIELPGGVMDAADPGPVASAIREVAEETGYGSGRAKLISSLALDPAKLSNHLHLVLIEGAEALGPPALGPGEDIELMRIPVAEALALVTASGLINAAHIGLLLLGLDAAGRISLEAGLPTGHPARK